MDVKTWAVRLATVAAAVATYALAATLLKGTSAEQPVAGLAGLLVGLVLPQLGKAESK